MKIKFKTNFLKNLIIVALFIALIIGHNISRENSTSKRNEIFNLTKQLISKNQQLYKIQRNLKLQGQDVNEVLNPRSIIFKKTVTNKQLNNFPEFQITKYKTQDILKTANFNALASAYLDFYNDNQVLIATYDGVFAIANIDNLKDFKKIKSNIKQIIKYDDFYNHDHYGIKDILVDGNTLYVSYIGEEEKNCHNLKIIKSNINFKKLDFELFYKTPNCIKKLNSYGEFLAQQGAGGRMVNTSKNSIFFTTGEFRFRTLSQEKSSHYGKILEIDKNTKKAKVISLGHRNPQGLYFSKKHNFLISTEHGPSGGDEVNINLYPRKNIKNYGWPISSYGNHYYKNYSKEKLKKAPLNKSHKKYKFVEPIKYFVPSIGISQIIPINKEETKFIFGAMGNEISEKDLSLHYIKLNNERTKVIEHKHEVLNERVRDIIITKDLKKIFLFLETSSSLAVINVSQN